MTNQLTFCTDTSEGWERALYAFPARFGHSCA